MFFKQHTWHAHMVFKKMIAGRQLSQNKRPEGTPAWDALGSSPVELSMSGTIWLHTNCDIGASPRFPDMRQVDHQRQGFLKKKTSNEFKVWFQCFILISYIFYSPSSCFCLSFSTFIGLFYDVKHTVTSLKSAIQIMGQAPIFSTSCLNDVPTVNCL